MLKCKVAFISVRWDSWSSTSSTNTPQQRFPSTACVRHRTAKQKHFPLSLPLSFSTHFSHLTGAEKCPLLWTHLQFSALTPASLSPLIPPPFFTDTGRLSVSVNPCNSFIYFIIFWSPFVLAVFLVIISCNLFAWHTSEKMGRVKYKTLITREGEGERENVCVHVKGCNLVQLNCLYSDCTVSQNDCI